MERSDGQAIKISPKVIQRGGGVVVLPIKEYQKLLASAVPTYYLKGKAASQLDRLVANGLNAHRSGKSKAIRSLSDLDTHS